MVEILALGILVALLWIGRELHRIVREFREFMLGYIEGYQEAIARRQGN